MIDETERLLKEIDKLNYAKQLAELHFESVQEVANIQLEKLIETTKDKMKIKNENRELHAKCAALTLENIHLKATLATKNENRISSNPIPDDWIDFTHALKLLYSAWLVAQENDDNTTACMHTGYINTNGDLIIGEILFLDRCQGEIQLKYNNYSGIEKPILTAEDILTMKWRFHPNMFEL